MTETQIVIHPAEKQDFSTYVPIPECAEKLEAIEAAGVVGAGGAGFPLERFGELSSGASAFRLPRKGRKFR